MCPTHFAPSPALFRRARTLLLVLAILCLGATLVNGAIYVKIPGVPGDVTTKGYNDGSWVEAFSGSYGVERDLVQSLDDGTADLNIGVGRFLPIGMACHLNGAAAPLAQAAVDGNLIGDVEIHLVDLEGAEPETFSMIRLQRAFVKAFTMDSPGDARPWFQAFFVYSHIEITNRLPDLTGTPEQIVSWNLVTNSDSPLVVDDAMQSWLDEFFTEEEQANPEIAGLFLDIDKDGLPAVVEFKLDTNPWDPTDGPSAVQCWMANVDGQKFLEISFVQRTDASTPNVGLKVEVGEGGDTWETGTEVVDLVSATPLGEDLEEVVCRLTRSRAEKPRQFVRLSVSYSGGAE